MATPRLAMPYITASQSQKEVTHNEALNALDIAVSARVLDRDLTAPPGSPVQGGCYLVGPGATGDWAGHDGQIAGWIGAAWTFVAPADGMIIYVVDEDVILVLRGGTWGALANAAGWTIGTDVQAHAAKLDALAGLTWGSDLAPYFTGTGSVGTYAVSSFMRGLAASASAAAMRRAASARAYIDPVPAAVIKGAYASHVTIAGAVRSRLTPVPALDGIATLTGIYPGGGAFWGAVLLPDGRGFCVPFTSTSAAAPVGAFSHRDLNFPMSLLLGGTLNKF